MFNLKDKAKDLFGEYVFYTNITIFALIFLVPVGAYLITGNTAYLSWEHFVLAGAVGLLQIFATRFFRKKLFRYLENIKTNFNRLNYLLREVKKVKDIRTFREEKEKLLEPLMEEINLKPLGESLNILLNELTDIFETKLFKEELIRRLTTTLETAKLSNILANNLIRFFDLYGVAIYLKDLRGNTYQLKLRKGLDEVEPILDEAFLEKIKDSSSLWGEEELPVSVDLGLFKFKFDRIYYHKLLPRKDKLIGVIFFAPSNGADKIYKLKNFLSELEPTLSLIFENALEHEKSLTLASFDALTGAYNRREGIKLLKQILKKAFIENRNLCLVILDIDHFKKFNDTYGHDAGDEVLKEVVRIIRNSIRSQDIIIRWGGEEFLIVLNDIPPEKSKEVAERIRKNIEKHTITLPNGETVYVTASLGVACTQTEGTYLFDELFLIADKRLYKAKQLGRNQVVAL